MEAIEMKVFEELSLQNYKRWIIPFVDEALEISNIKRGSILDIGCGPGLLVREFVRRSKDFSVSGIDISTEAIRIARKKMAADSGVKSGIGSGNKISYTNRIS